MPQFWQIIASSLFVLLLASCDERQSSNSADGKFYISHNNKDALYFKIDNHPIKLIQGEIKHVDLQSGKHTIEYPIGQKTEFIVYPGNQGGIINPTRQYYYAYSSVFKEIISNQSLFLKHNQIIVDGIKVQGPILSSNALLIDNNVFKCDYAIGTSFLNVLALNKSKQLDRHVKTKCFTKEEFIHFLSLVESKVDNIHIIDKGINEQNTVTHSFEYALPMANFNNYSLQSYANKIVEIVDNFKNINNVESKAQIYEEYYQYLYNMAKVYSSFHLGQNKHDRDEYSAFINQTNMIFNAGILKRRPAKIYKVH
ncbi:MULTISPECIES: hypothetical protein [Arsenophonus]|jgi:hypothetical protein|uniref:hypothetical protein n=1 Tax=Arsenophonus TaxID=637 RepID=UPI0015D852BB|nr:MULTISPECIES: hypothetical protein [Arsenophonus]UBX30462.1 hypothetical protein LDL57_07755 [Arsenophonus apicola]